MKLKKENGWWGDDECKNGIQKSFVNSKTKTKKFRFVASCGTTWGRARGAVNEPGRPNDPVWPVSGVNPQTNPAELPLLCSAAKFFFLPPPPLPPFRPTTSNSSIYMEREGKGKKKRKEKNLTRQIHACATNVSTGWHPNKKKKKRRERLFQIARATLGPGEQSKERVGDPPHSPTIPLGGCQFPQDVSRTHLGHNISLRYTHNT